MKVTAANLKLPLALVVIFLHNQNVFSQKDKPAKEKINFLIDQYQTGFRTNDFKLMKSILTDDYQLSQLPPGQGSFLMLLGLMKEDTMTTKYLKCKILREIVKNDTVTLKLKLSLPNRNSVNESMVIIQTNDVYKIHQQEGRVIDMFQTRTSNGQVVVQTTISKADFKEVSNMNLDSLSNQEIKKEINKVIEGDTLNRVDKNGNPNGKWKRLYSNGSFMCEGEYINGKKEGYWHKNYENGKLMYECYYHEGKYNGVCKNYYENGNLKDEGNYVNGLPDGEIRKYYSNGQIQSVEQYIQGKLNCPCEYYDNNGKKLKKKISHNR